MSGYVSTLKIDEASFNRLAEAVSVFDTEANRQAYREGRFPRAERTKDVDMRFRWDCMWAAQAALRAETEHRNPSEHFGLEGLNSEHIDSALRRIVRPLGEH